VTFRLLLPRQRQFSPFYSAWVSISRSPRAARSVVPEAALYHLWIWYLRPSHRERAQSWRHGVKRAQAAADWPHRSKWNPDHLLTGPWILSPPRLASQVPALSLVGALCQSMPLAARIGGL